MGHLTLEAKERIVRKALNRGNTALSTIARENNIGYSTLQGWAKDFAVGTLGSSCKSFKQIRKITSYYSHSKLDLGGIRGRLDGGKDACRPKQTNELSEETKIKLMEVINSKKYCDLPPCKIVPLLADEGCYIASASTIYMVLRKERPLTHRTKSKSKKHSKPQSFVASKPNQVWSWDISYLPTTVRCSKQ